MGEALDMAKKKLAESLNLNEGTAKPKEEVKNILDETLDATQRTEAKMFQAAKLEAMRREAENQAAQLRKGATATESTEPKKKMFSAIGGEVIQDPDGTLTLDEAIKVATFQRGKTEPSKSISDRLDTVLTQVLAKKLESMLGETEEESPRQSLLRDLKEVEELKEALEALGVKKDSSVAEQLAKESSTRPEIIKILLEDERERLKLKKEYELAMAKEQTSLENYKLTKPIVTEVLGTLKETQGKYNKRATKKGAKVFKALCPHCQSPLTFSKKPVGQFTCPECNKVVKVKSE